MASVKLTPRVSAVALLLLLLTVQDASTVNIFFDVPSSNEIQFTLSENGPNAITVRKTGPNVGPVTLSIRFFTFEAYDMEIAASTLSLPTATLPAVRPEAAEVEPLPGDFDDTPQEITFPPNPNDDSMTIPVTITDDGAFEPVEGFIVRLAISSIEVADVLMLAVSTADTALINIVDNDGPPLYAGMTLFEAIEGQQFRIMLSLTGSPSVSTLSWTFNGQELSIGGGIDFGLDFLEFDSINRTDAGTYRVFSSNAAGNDSFELEVVVFYPPEYTVNDTFTVVEGSSFSLQLDLQGNPLPTDNDTDWFVNGAPLMLMPGIDFGSDFINIQMVTRLDRGNYTVNSTNIAGFGTASFQLFVEFGAATTTEPLTTTDAPLMTTEMPMSDGFGGDPHFSIILPTGQLLCFSVQGENNFTFNLVSNDLFSINARFDQDAKRPEVTWIGSLGVVTKKTRVRFEASTKTIHIDGRAALSAVNVGRLVISRDKLNISEASQNKREVDGFPVEVVMSDAGLSFTVKFMKSHIDMLWHSMGKRLPNSHGILGQFFRDGVEVDEARKLLQLPSPDMEPVPVMRKPVWHFMERETAEDQLCWVAMNPGYQGKRLIEGHYLDYLVDDVLSSKFKFKAGKYEKLMQLLLKK